jgi:Zn ribbon nucleic-acid-binding protein
MSACNTTEAGTELPAVRPVPHPRRYLVLLSAALLAVTLALAPRAEAFVYWTESFGDTIGRANVDGTGVDKRFITGARNPSGVAVDAAHVYWTQSKTNTIGRANLNGTGVDKRFITGADYPSGVAVDAAHIYWTNQGSGTGGGTTIGRANLDGTGVDPSFITGAEDPSGLAVDAAHVYWANFFGDTIGRANLDGTSADKSFITRADFGCGVAVDAAHVYWTAIDPCGLVGGPDGGTDSCENAIGRANLDGTGIDQSFIETGGPVGGAEPSGVAVDGGHVYWANYSGYSKRWNFIGRANLDGTGANRHFITSAVVASPGAVAVDALRSFSISKVRKNKRRGTAKLAVKVPGSGKLKLAQTNEVKGANQRADAKGKAKLPVRPRGKAKKELNAKGKAKVEAEVTYSPDGGDPNIVASTLTKRLRLVRRG